MSLRTAIGLSRESLLEEGTPDEVAEKKRRALDEELRPKRVEVARRSQRWTEIENDLVPRGRGWYVSAGSDLIYQRARGTIFQPYTAVAVADQVELAYYIGDDGDLNFLERVKQPATWSEHVRRKAEKERRRNAPRRKPSWMEP